MGSPRDALQIDEQQKLKNKKQRYIEYGSDDDSDKSQPIFQKTPRTRPHPKSAIIRKQEVSSSDDEPIGKRKKYSSSELDAETPHTADVPKKRNKNKKTGNVEPDRFDDD